MNKLMKYACGVACVLVVGCTNLKPVVQPPAVKDVDVDMGPVKIMTALTTTNIMGGSSYRKAYEISFTGGGDFTWKKSATAPAIRSVEMSYPTGVTNYNIFSLTYLRNGVSRDLLITSNTMHTVTWYVPSDFYALEGDVWSWTNSAAGAAILTINADFQY